MKRNKLKYLINVLIIILLSNTVIAKRKKSQFITRYHFPRQMILKSGGDYIVILPIGWSRDGKFAFVYFGDSNPHYIITGHYHEKGMLGTEFEPYEKKDWEKDTFNFKKKLKKHKIIQEINPRIHSFPIRYRKDNIFIKINIKTALFKQWNEWKKNRIFMKELRIYLVSKKSRKKKLLYKRIFKYGGYTGISKPLGYFKSPYDNNIVIYFILKELDRQNYNEYQYKKWIQVKIK